ncbi:MAG: universal stress protein [Myxococcales bacterium]|nr:universal stress protein [Myxococcales bacterium]
MKWNAVRHVLAPIDLAEPDDTGVRLALEAAGHADNVHVMYVLPPVEVSPMLPDPATKIAEVRAELRTWLEQRGLPPGIRTHVSVSTAPEKAISELAGALKVDLVILPSHGRSGLSRLLLGSVAEQIIRHSPCPVLVLKPGRADP